MAVQPAPIQTTINDFPRGWTFCHPHHRVASLLKRWILGTHQGSIGVEHLQSYLDEFVFRFNRRSSRSRGLLFYRLLQQAVGHEPIPKRHIH
jgi:hypothetical protein